MNLVCTNLIQVVGALLFQRAFIDVIALCKKILAHVDLRPK